MNKIIAAIAGIAALSMATIATAQDMSAMMGKWKWQEFVVEMGPGGDHGVSAMVIAGPANVGMEMMQSAMMPKDGGMVARIKHPANGEVYNAKISFLGPDSWKMDGCTDAGACASGVFNRVK